MGKALGVHRDGRKGSLPQFLLFKNCKKLLSMEGRNSCLPSGKCFLYHVDEHIQVILLKAELLVVSLMASGEEDIKGHTHFDT